MPNTIKNKPPVVTIRVVFLGMLFVSFLIASNLTAFKIVEYHVFKGMIINFPAALVFFPLTYFFGEFINATVLAKLKVLTHGRYFTLRVMSSSALGIGIDTVIFCNIAFWSVLPLSLIWTIIVTQYIIKLAFEAIMLPVTWHLANYLKKKDKVDYFDNNTQFNLFSLTLNNH